MLNGLAKMTTALSSKVTLKLCIMISDSDWLMWLLWLTTHQILSNHRLIHWDSRFYHLIAISVKHKFWLGKTEKLTEMEAAIKTLQSQGGKLLDKVANLENWYRHSNLRIINVSKGSEGQDPAKFVLDLLMTVTGSLADPRRQRELIAPSVDLETVILFLLSRERKMSWDGLENIGWLTLILSWEYTQISVPNWPKYTGLSLFDFCLTVQLHCHSWMPLTACRTDNAQR